MIRTPGYVTAATHILVYIQHCTFRYLGLYFANSVLIIISSFFLPGHVTRCSKHCTMSCSFECASTLKFSRWVVLFVVSFVKAFIFWASPCLSDWFTASCFACCKTLFYYYYMHVNHKMNTWCYFPFSMRTYYFAGTFLFTPPFIYVCIPNPH